MTLHKNPYGQDRSGRGDRQDTERNTRASRYHDIGLKTQGKGKDVRWREIAVVKDGRLQSEGAFSHQQVCPGINNISQAGPGTRESARPLRLRRQEYCQGQHARREQGYPCMWRSLLRGWITQ
ncbi:hypothetical protein PoB_005771600 [Plakobranchus ocellatus]|uniref:Uncharacterized protein n=1 Tax=Plakobranchus ocellatus TaxID=259542 RepID=A0AAV4C7E8_9GAST|nr:hypothetical protein PoB_005771600 [Plakobranchus ocellatus]